MGKKLFRIAMVALILIPMMDVSAASVAPERDHTAVYCEGVDYSQIMYDCAMRGDSHSMALGEICEERRNTKIDDLGMDHAKTNYFKTYSTGDEILQAMKIDRLRSEYPVAGQVYEYLSRRGYSDPVIAGILGNMMAECGGQTLDLQWWIYGGRGRYYGLCMWSLYYGPDVNGRDVIGQLDYLTGNIAENMAQFGGSHEHFQSIQDAGYAARYFCAYYERGAGSGVRAKNAYRALAWITG